MDYRPRQTRLVDALTTRHLKAALITHLPNIRYICGFTGSNAVLVVLLLKTGRAQLALFTDGRYTLQAKQEVKGTTVIIAPKSALIAALEWLVENSSGMIRCGVETNHLTHSFYLTVKAAAPSRIHLQPIPQMVERLRMIKDTLEIAQIRKAVNLASNVFKAILPEIKSGLPENALAAQIEYLCRRMGAEGMSFETLVSSGLRSAMPHGVATSHPFPRKGFILMDFGVRLGGYCSDMSRTVHIGPVSPRAKRVYEAVKASQEAGIKAVKGGALTSEVDYACRNTLKKEGLDCYFTHSTGHGVGLEIHEVPGLRADSGTKNLSGNSARRGKIVKIPKTTEPDRLLPGMVVTIEPGVYIPGFGGVRIEDMVLVTKTGCEVLTPTIKELLVF
jgi:Xaa-Pro aminopeptidase